jgi:hypothetical protein
MDVAPDRHWIHVKKKMLRGRSGSLSSLFAISLFVPYLVIPKGYPNPSIAATVTESAASGCWCKGLFLAWLERNQSSLFRKLRLYISRGLFALLNVLRTTLVSPSL